MGRRERYSIEGPDGLGDSELIALVIGAGTRSSSARDIARAALDRFGGLSGLLEAPVAALSQVPGIGPARAVRLHAGLSAGRRTVRRATDLPLVIDRPELAVSWFGPRLVGQSAEELHALYLDRRLRVVEGRRLTRGSDAFTVVDPRQVFRPAIACGAAAVIVAHNHPSGDPTPSDRDRDVTRRLCRSGRVLGVPLMDHIVVADRGFRSLAELGECGDLAWPVTPQV